ncbi:MAG TPA: hypothetical protein VFG50_00395 [Rhodothermales bacterium]|nr:hypothetical protein [Rhodothermales bacterium]
MSTNFIGYLIGYIIAIVGVGYALNAAGVGQQWIIAAVLIMIGLGIVYALTRSERDRAIRPKQVREDTVERRDEPDRRPAGDGETRSTTTTRSYD